MVFHGVNTRSLVTLGQARGAILAAVGTRQAALTELSPSEIKKAVTGRGGATKEQVAHMVGVLLGPRAREVIAAAGAGLDATDALAVALACLHRTPRQAAPSP
jgi:crossover junction endodeoxyribonuclease RuvC